MTPVDWNQRATLREQVLLGFVVVALFLLFLKIVYFPKSDNNQVLSAKIQGLTLERNALAKFSESTPIVPRFSLSGKEDMRMRILTGEIRPAFKDIHGLLKEMTHPSLLGGLRVSSLSYLPSTKEEGYLKTDFTLTLTGLFGNILQYLERTEQFPALFQIDDIAIKVEENNPTMLDAELRGRFFEIGVAGGT